MEVLIYEFVSGGGLYHEAIAPSQVPSLLREGLAMLQAVATDFTRVDGINVHILMDQRAVGAPLENVTCHTVDSPYAERQQFHARLTVCDRALIIAPECHGWLRDRVVAAEKAGACLLGPDSVFVALTADKHETARWLKDHRVPVPHSVPLDSNCSTGGEITFPAVLKPRLGAGSMDTWLVTSWDQAMAIAGAASEFCVQSYCPGRAASVAFLCGPAGVRPLAPCWQFLSDDGRFSYHGGALIRQANHKTRARRLAERAMAALPKTRGFVGVDLILGPEPDGSQDVVIEVNPRLTTSYIGLRAAARQNLALAMLQTVDGVDSPVSFQDLDVQFDTYGKVTATQHT